MRTRQTLTVLLTCASAALLLGAWGFQYIGGYAPCKMCYWQRYPHMAAFGLGLLLIATKHRIFAWLAALATATTGGLGVFHSGVERKLWDGPSTCTSSGVDGLSQDELFSQIMSAPLVRCDEIPWDLFGVSMANLNALFSFVCAALWLWVALKRD